MPASTGALSRRSFLKGRADDDPPYPVRAMEIVAGAEPPRRSVPPLEGPSHLDHRVVAALLHNLPEGEMRRDEAAGPIGIEQTVPWRARTSASVDHTVAVFSISKLGAEIWLAIIAGSPAL